MTAALEGVQVLSLTHILPSSYCTMLLADLGAEVIVVEPPGQSIYNLPGLDFADRNSRSIGLNLRSDEGKKICRQLAKESDVVLEEFRPGVAKRLALDYDTIKAINPSIIYCSISGCGQDGPYRDRPGHAPTYMAMAGLYSFVPDVACSNPGIPIADLSSGMFATIGILAALRARDKTGKGQHVDCSMTDGCVSMASGFLDYYSITGTRPGDLKSGLFDPAGLCFFETKDGKYIVLGHANEEHLWHNLCRAVGKPELVEVPLAERRGPRINELTEIIKQAISTKTRDEWATIFAAGDVAFGPGYEMDEVTSDPQVKHRLVVEIDDPKKGKRQQIGHPLKYSETPAEIRSLPFTPAEHTDEILLKMGYHGMDIQRLKKEGVVFGP